MSEIKTIIKDMLKKRQTVKAYSDKKITDDDWNLILQSIYWAPTSLGAEPYRVLIINKDHELRKKLFPIMWNQGPVLEADKLVFFISLKKEAFTNQAWLTKRAKRSVEEIRQLKGDEAIKAIEATSKNYANFIKTEQYTDQWSKKQAYIALGASMNAAIMLNIGSTPMEGLETKKIETLFKNNQLINNDENLAVAVAFGYPKNEQSYAHYGSGKRVRDSWTTKFKEI